MARTQPVGRDATHRTSGRQHCLSQRASSPQGHGASSGSSSRSGNPACSARSKRHNAGHGGRRLPRRQGTGRNPAGPRDLLVNGCQNRHERSQGATARPLLLPPCDQRPCTAGSAWHDALPVTAATPCRLAARGGRTQGGARNSPRSRSPARRPGHRPDRQLGTRDQQPEVMVVGRNLPAV